MDEDVLKISVDDARAYFAHPSQQVLGADPDNLPEQMDYRADGPVCLIFHTTPHPGVWMVHLAVKPEGWGMAVGPAQRLLVEFWGETHPRRIVAWIEEHRRAAIAFAHRVGMTEDGRFPGTIMMGWAKWAA